MGLAEPNRIVVLGAGGQVGRALRLVLPEALFWGRAEADLTKAEELKRRLKDFRPQVVINAAAYTAVDQAESERDLCWQINAEAPGHLARLCHELGSSLIHYSTDYIFSGEGERPWTESDPPAPINHYGASKAEGERLVRAAGCRHLILRTSWVYAPEGKNFLLTMLNLLKSKPELRVVSDQFGAPTSAALIARVTRQLLAKVTTSETLNLTAKGSCSWYDFAELIRSEMARAQQVAGQPAQLAKLVPIPSREYPTPAQRPKNSRLSGEKLARLLGEVQPEWQIEAGETVRRVIGDR